MLVLARRAAITLVLLVVAGVLAPRPAVAGDPRGALAVAPSGAGMAIGVDLEQLRATRHWPKMREAVRGNGELGGALAALEQAGLAEDDVTSVVVVALGKPVDGSRFALIADGDFARFDVATLGGAVRRVRHKVAYYVVGERHAMARVGRYLVVATVAELEAVIDVHAKKRKGLAARKGLRAQLAAVGARGDLWLWASVAALPSAVPIDGLVELAASIDLDAGVAGTVRLVHKDEASASAIEQQVRTATAALGASGGPAAGFAAGTTVSRSGTAVDLAFTLDQTQLDLLTAMLAL